MQAEREQLVKFVFPELRHRFRARGIQIVDIDLRWGITEQQVKSGETLPLCLAEIERSRPYFIVLLGQRYGWVPERLDPAVVADQPWLATFEGRSVTELEIVHGILSDPTRAQRALIYFRDPRYVETLPKDDQVDFLPESAEAVSKLDRLKQMIRSASIVQQENYPDPKTLGGYVLQDLTRIIEEEFPSTATLNKLEGETALHDAAAESSRGRFAGFAAELRGMHEAFATGQLRLVVLGDEGSGKSALLSEWLDQIKRIHPQVFILNASIGATADSVDYVALLQFLTARSLEGSSLPSSLRPEKNSRVVQEFGEALSFLAKQRPVLLAIDGIDQFVDRFACETLRWLPHELPLNVSTIFSAQPNFFLDALQNRGFTTLRLQPMAKLDRCDFINGYLKDFGKHLAAADVEAIAEHPGAGHPLFIRAILEALRLRADFFSLRKRLGVYLEARNPRELYERILPDLEKDLDARRPMLTRDALRLLWATRNGLSETELRDLLGCDGEPLPQAFWSPLYIALDGSLINRGGLLSLKQESLRQAVHARYFKEEFKPTALDTSLAALGALDLRFYRTRHVEKEREIHLRIGEYLFPSRLTPDEDVGQRALNEGMEQLARAHAWTALAERLSRSSILQYAWQERPSTLANVWKEVEEHSVFRVCDAFQESLAKPGSDEATERALAGLLEATGHQKEASHLLRSTTKQTGDSLPAATRHDLIGTARDAFAGDDLVTAAVRAESAAEESREERDFETLHAALTLLATIYGKQGRRNDVIKVLRERERLSQYS